jgi:hypothetical protein
MFAGSSAASAFRRSIKMRKKTTERGSRTTKNASNSTTNLNANNVNATNLNANSVNANNINVVQAKLSVDEDHTTILNEELDILYKKIPKFMRRFKCRLLDWFLMSFFNELLG